MMYGQIQSSKNRNLRASSFAPERMNTDVRIGIKFLVLKERKKERECPSVDWTSELRCESLRKETSVNSNWLDKFCLFEHRFRSKYYKRAFCGNEFVDWVLVVGLAPDRAQAAKYGRHLLTGRVMRHYENEHHFHDQPLFYTFHDATTDEYLYHPLESTVVQWLAQKAR